MNKQEAKHRIEKLKELVNYHRYQYHVLDKHFPEFITADSPTQRVGGKPLPEFKKVPHKERMLSLNDAFSKEDMQDWLERISKLLTEQEKNQIDFYCELKIDG